ncbi:MAG: hypothetical protein JWR61_5834 [Ferruginibacter sp.]|uniref:hypothetical protein n=1 Tax=Ferruginibacter sp. TaxID=1940288 RepID=UPI002658D442|nr:hypothetical protein [Ferruginibacter sp.]MDB5280879.1 hypothetical protein [Ferruginibacter sp.]
MAQAKNRPTEEVPQHRILREVFRHYLEFREYVGSTGNHVIEHGYFLYEDDGVTIKDKIAVTISFWDLFNGLKDLSPRKREAVWYNVILDQKQRDVAKRMNITTVSVGQYVEQAMLQLSERYFAPSPEIHNGLLVTKPKFEELEQEPEHVEA